MSDYSLFTSESVSEGHPDKMSDQISDAILDTYLTKDPDARVAVETLVKTGMVVVAGEVTTSAAVTTGELEEAIRQTVLDIGFDSSDVCFDGNTCAVINAIGQQSADIALGTQEADEANQGAGDQGLMFGFASDETDVLMPAPIHYSHRLVEKQAELRKSGALPWLRPDAKSQITMRYGTDGKPDTGELVAGSGAWRESACDYTPSTFPLKVWFKNSVQEYEDSSNFHTDPVTGEVLDVLNGAVLLPYVREDWAPPPSTNGNPGELARLARAYYS